MVRVPNRVFHGFVERAIAAVPQPFAELLERVPVIVDNVPSDAVRETVEAPDELLGLYVGPPLAEWDRPDTPPETAVIYLFRFNLEDACESRAELEEQVRITLFHELGHALGFDEDGLERLGLE